MKTYDPAPLLAQAARRWAASSAVALAGVLGVSPRTICRWRAGFRIRDDVADELAVRAGTHPACLWPEWLEDLVPARVDRPEHDRFFARLRSEYEARWGASTVRDLAVDTATPPGRGAGGEVGAGRGAPLSERIGNPCAGPPLRCPRVAAPAGPPT